MSYYLLRSVAYAEVFGVQFSSIRRKQSLRTKIVSQHCYKALTVIDNLYSPILMVVVFLSFSF